MLLGLEVKTWLGFAVVGALVSTVGALLGVALKEYFFVRSFDRWKQKQTLEQVYQRYRDPLFLSGRELASRLIEIDENFPTVYLKADILASSPIHLISNSINDPYYQRYKLLSSIFRLSAFLGWLELYRQDVTWLKSGSNRHSKKLEHVVELIRGDLADGQLNTAPDRVDWRDMLIFREELRAVGESMLEGSVGAKVVVGYCRFCEALEVNSNNHIRR